MTTIDAWTIYWVMQADSIKALLIVIAVIVAGLWVFWSIGTGICCQMAIVDRIESAKKDMKFAIVGWVFATIVAFAAVIVATLAPSTKTAATMIVLPAIVNNKDIQTEAKELYDIAKGALRDIATESKEGN